MSTSVADLVATLRADASDFIAGMQAAGNATNQLNQQAGSMSGLMSMGQAIADITAVVSGAFVAGIGSAIGITNSFNQAIQASDISFQGLGASVTQAAKLTQQGLSDSVTLGIDPAQVQKTQQLLVGLVGASADTTANITRLAGAAATSQQPLSGVADQVARIANIMSASPQMGQWLAQGLASQNIESYSNVLKAQKEAASGGGESEVFQTLMDGLHGANGAAGQYADTLTGLRSSLKTMGSEAISSVFTPIYNAELQALQGLKSFGESTQAQTAIQTMASDVQKMIPDVDNLVTRLTKLASTELTPANIDKFMSDLKTMVPLITTLTGIGSTDVLSKVLGRIPVIGDILGPLTQIGGLMGALAGTSSGRQSIEDMAGAFAKLGQSVAEALPGIMKIFDAIIGPIADIVKLAAGVVELTSAFKPLDEAIGVAIVLFAGMKAWEGMIGILNSVRTAMQGVSTSMSSTVTGAQSTQAMVEAQAAYRDALEQTGAAEDAATQAEVMYADAQKASADAAMYAANTQKILDNESAEATDVLSDRTHAYEQNTIAVLNQEQANRSLAASEANLLAANSTMTVGVTGGADEATQVTNLAAVTDAEKQVAEAKQAVAEAAAIEEQADRNLILADSDLTTQDQRVVEATKEKELAFDAAAEAADRLAQAQGIAGDADTMLIAKNTELDASLVAMGAASDAQSLASRYGGAAMGVGLGASLAFAGSQEGGVMGAGTSVMGGAMAGAGIGSLIMPGVGTAIGAGAGALGGLAMNQILDNGPTNEQKKATADSNAFNTNNQVSLDNLSQMKERLDAATAAVTKYKAAQTAADTKESPFLSGADGSGQQGHIQDFQKIVDASQSSIKNFQANVQAAMKASGDSMAEVVTQAQQLNVDLSNMVPGSDTAKNAIDGLTAALKTNQDQLVQSQNQASATADALAMSQFANTDLGKTGQSTFTVSPQMVQQMQTEVGQFKSEGYDTTDLQFDANQVQKQQGNTFGTQQQLTDQQKNLETTQKATQLQQQLAEAQYGVVQAAQAEADAEFNLTKSFQGVIDANNQLADAQFQLSQATLKNNEANATQADDFKALQDSLSGFTDKYADLNAGLDELLPNEQTLGAQIVAQAQQLQQATNAYTTLNNQYNLLNDSLQQLTDTMQAYQNLANQPLQGSSQMAEQIQQNKMAQDALQMQITTAELGGANTQSSTIVNLENQLDVLKAQGQQLQLQQEMTLGNQQFKIGQAEQAPEIDFSQALAAAQQVGTLETAVQTTTQQLDNFKPGLDAAKTAMDALTQSTQPEIQALQNLEQANESVLTASNSLINSQHSLTQASWAVTDAQHAVMDATNQVKSAQMQYQQAVNQVNNTYTQMALNTIQNNLDMTNSVIQYVQDFETQLGQLQLMTTNTTNTMKSAFENFASQAKTDVTNVFDMLTGVGSGSSLQNEANQFATSIVNGMHANLKSSNGSTVNIGPGAVQVGIEGVPGAGEVAGQVMAGINSAFSQLLSVIQVG